MTHVSNQTKTPAAMRAAEQEELDASQFVGKNVEWDPGDKYGPRRGVVTGYGRYDEGANRIGALCLNAERTDGERQGTKFSFPFASRDKWRVISGNPTINPDPEAIVREANLIAKEAMDRSASDERWLHKNGYHAYSAAMSNFRVKIERALGELVEEVMPDA